MNDKELIEYHDANGVRPYHGIKAIDALMHLSEIPGLPPVIAKDYYDQYDLALRRLETSRVPDMGKNLYHKYRGQTSIERGDTIKEFTWEGVTFRSVEIKMVRFERMNEYFREHGEAGFRKTTYPALEIEAAGTSTLQQLLDRPNTKDLFSVDGLLVLCDKQEWDIINTYHKPYNGIDANDVVRIFEDLVKRMGRESKQNVTSYIKSVTEHYYGFDTAPILETIKNINSR